MRNHWFQKRRWRAAAWVLCVISLCNSRVHAQATASEQEKNPPTRRANTPAPAELSQAARAKQAASEEETVVLSPFEVIADNNGYMASNTASGTRLNSRLQDIAAPISVVTKQQLRDLAAVDINDIFRSEANTEGLFQYTEFQNDRGNLVDVASNNPEAANRIRGMGSANISYGGMSVSGVVPVDAYNIDSVEIARGANSNIFGIGSTSGTVNINVSEANMTRDFTRVSTQVDSYEGHRHTFDLNRMVWKNRLGLRFLGVYDEVGYIRQPAFDITKRFTAALRAQPFKHTAIKVSYETYRNSATRPNVMTPRQLVTAWRDAGSHTWDPVTYTVYDANNNPLGQYVGTTGTNAVPGTALLLSRFNLATAANANRATVGYSQGVIDYYVSSQNGGSGNQRLVEYAFPTITTNVTDINPATGQPYGRIRSTIDNLVSIHGEEGRALYDWERYNTNAANFSTKSSDMLKFQIEQMFLHTPTHHLAGQFSGFMEDIGNDSWNYIGNGGDGVQPILYVDINRRLPNGAANPGFMRPYFAGFQPQFMRRPEENQTFKAQLAYVFNATHHKGWTRWIGRHNFLAYGEDRVRQFAPGALRYRTLVRPRNLYTATFLQPAQIPEGYLAFPADILDSLNTRYYLGDNAGFNIDAPAQKPRTNTTTYSYWGGSTNAAVGVPLAWRNANVTMDDVHFSGRTERNEIDTRGGVWQGFLWSDRIIPTIGYRQDKVRFKRTRQHTDPRFGNTPFDFGIAPLGRTISGTTSLVTTDTFVTDPNQNTFVFGDEYEITDRATQARIIKGRTRQQGVVVKPFLGWERMGFLQGLQFTYNQSDSFEPVGLAANTLGEVLPNPTGKSKDYGVRLTLLDDRLWISLNRYEAVQTNSRAGFAAVLATRAFRYDFDTGESADGQVGANIGGTDLFDWYFTQIWGPTAAATRADPVYLASKGITTIPQMVDHIYELMGYSREQINRVTGVPITATNDIRSEGYELEVNYNTRHWFFKLTGAKKDAMDIALAPALKQYLDWRLPIWQSATWINQTPGTQNFGQPVRFWTEVPNPRENDFNNVVYNQYNLAVANLGKTRAQLRQYTVSLTTRYKLSGITDHHVLKNLTTGIFASWSSKASIGYGWAEPEQNLATGEYVVRFNDANKRYYDKARGTMDWFAIYDFKMFGRVKSSVQLNVKNVFEDGRLQAVSVNSDGTPWAYRIIDPRKFIVSLNMEF
jgi:hypothetical protein